jgi:predicted nucleic acid-binding protein
MVFYFFNSSALAKQYHSEPGSQIVVERFSGRENCIFTSRLALVELTSVAGIKVRTGAMTPEKADEFLISVSAGIDSREFVSQRVVEVDYVRAQQLLNRHAPSA